MKKWINIIGVAIVLVWIVASFIPWGYVAGEESDPFRIKDVIFDMPTAFGPYKECILYVENNSDMDWQWASVSCIKYYKDGEIGEHDEPSWGGIKKGETAEFAFDYIYNKLEAIEVIGYAYLGSDTQMYEVILEEPWYIEYHV